MHGPPRKQRRMTKEIRIKGSESEAEIKLACKARLVHHRSIQDQCLQKARKICQGSVPHGQHQPPVPWPKAQAGQGPIQLRRRQFGSILSNRKHERRKLSFVVMKRYNLVLPLLHP
jgi:hypothetical protein